MNLNFQPHIERLIAFTFASFHDRRLLMIDCYYFVHCMVVPKAVLSSLTLCLIVCVRSSSCPGRVPKLLAVAVVRVL